MRVLQLKRALKFQVMTLSIGEMKKDILLMLNCVPSMKERAYVLYLLDNLKTRMPLPEYREFISRLENM